MAGWMGSEEDYYGPIVEIKIYLKLGPLLASSILLIVSIGYPIWADCLSWLSMGPYCLSCW